VALFHELNGRDMGARIALGGTLFISHDLPAVASLCDQVAILPDGEIVEQSSRPAIFGRPRHPYTDGSYPRYRPHSTPAACVEQETARSWDKLSR